MSPQMGRPKIANPKNVEIKVRFSDQASSRLLEYCKKHNLTRVEAIRQEVELLLAQDK